MTLRIIHDTHLGTIRSSGTTPATQLGLRQYLLDNFESLLPDSDLMILGDLFDKENIPISDVLKTYEILLDWLFKGHKLYLVAGNHDLSKTSSILSSFDFLGGLLTKLFPTTVTVVTKPQMTPYGYVIPHLPNQDLFNLELSKVPSCECLFLHCNFDNGFASQLDQSLNLSKEQAESAPTNQLIIAHEHHYQVAGKVLLPGNQIPSSCADWASHQDKFFTELVSTDGKSFQLVLTKCCIVGEEFIEADWTTSGISDIDNKFIRITGKATAEQASQVVSLISKVRQASKALVITNGVTIESNDVGIEFSQSMETVKSFNVWEALKKILTAEEVKTLEGVMYD